MTIAELQLWLRALALAGPRVPGLTVPLDDLEAFARERARARA